MTEFVFYILIGFLLAVIVWFKLAVSYFMLTDEIKKMQFGFENSQMIFLSMVLPILWGPISIGLAFIGLAKLVAMILLKMRK